jgi:hypothetical protein
LVADTNRGSEALVQQDWARFGVHFTQLVSQNEERERGSYDASSGSYDEVSRIARHAVGRRGDQVLVGALLFLLGSLLAYRIPGLEEKAQKKSGDYLKIAACASGALALDFTGLGLLVGIWQF